MSDLIVALAEQMLQSRKLAKRIMEHGDSDTSVLIDHKIEIEDGKATLKTELTILPSRRIYKCGSKIVDDASLTFETIEDWSL